MAPAATKDEFVADELNEKFEGQEGQHSWLNIHVEQEHYQPPRGGMILLQVLIGVLFFVVVIRFWYLQIHRGEVFAKQAIENRMRQEYILAPRGRILDLHDRILTDNRTAYGLSLVREDCPDIPATLAQISLWSGIPLPKVWEKYEQDRARIKPYEPLLMITDINFDLVARIEAELHSWPGLEIVVRTKRSYPERELFSHILGYVAEVNAQEMEKDQLLAMGDLVGKQGLELEMEKRLRGNKGLYAVEVDAHARIMSKTMEDEPRGGHDLRLSLDRDLQQACWDALQGESGCVVVMEPKSGKIRALVTSPAYDNNLFAEGISHRDWEELRTNKHFPLQNRAIQSVYPPGSVWKLLMAACFLENGVDPNQTVFCPGYAKLGKQIFRCWKHSGHGSLNMEQALIHSCDVYFYIMAERLGIDKIEAFAKNCGFGSPTGVDLPHERSGLVPSRPWKQRRFGKAWVRGDTFNASIGQGFVLVTPVQIANYVAALLNNGEMLKPQLLEHEPKGVIRKLPISREHIDFILNAMHRTATVGTARVVSRKDAVMGGKTGTAQVVKLRLIGFNRRMKNKDMAKAMRDHAWIATWGKKNGKTYVVVVMVEHGGGGSSVAGPVAKKVYEYLFDQGQLNYQRKNM
ncbi:MAG: penicillin-binding protein 2 [Desulfovibrionaceae bacterium]|nr:penicillin-binding protein 2 [Desulfovibrionaceae bacterium]